MTGVEFRVGHNQHLAVENFLIDDPPGVAGITVEADKLRHQQDVAATAHRYGFGVTVEPATERLVGPGGPAPKKLAYAGEKPLEPHRDLADESAREAFVTSVLKPQWALATQLVAPHFHVRNERDCELNLDLAAATVRAAGGEVPVRAPLSAALRDFLGKPGVAKAVADRYAQTGVSSIDLRPSPLSKTRETRRKIRDLLMILDDFCEHGPPVVLGLQGVFGPAALSLGLVETFSVGVGYREQYDYSQMMSSQKQPGTGGGPIAGVFLAEAGETIPPATAKALYQQQQLRTTLRCSLGKCGERIDGPVVDPAGHCLHARAKTVGDILKQPRRWRPKLLNDHLVKAHDLRERVNAHLPTGATPLDTATLHHLQLEVADVLDQAA